MDTTTDGSAVVVVPWYTVEGKMDTRATISASGEWSSDDPILALRCASFVATAAAWNPDPIGAAASQAAEALGGELVAVPKIEDEQLDQNGNPLVY